MATETQRAEQLRHEDEILQLYRTLLDAKPEFFKSMNYNQLSGFLCGNPGLAHVPEHTVRRVVREHKLTDELNQVASIRLAYNQTILIETPCGQRITVRCSDITTPYPGFLTISTEEGGPGSYPYFIRDDEDQEDPTCVHVAYGR